MPAARLPTRWRGAGRCGRSRCCAVRATMAATGLSRRASWPSAAGRCAWRCSATAPPSTATPRSRPGGGPARSSRSTPAASSGAGLVVDAMFGAGLARPIEGSAARRHRGAQSDAIPVVAVDVPSGVDGASGEVRGIAPRAALTVTFFRRKPGHLLLPGRDLCGRDSCSRRSASRPPCSTRWRRRLRPTTRIGGRRLFPWPGPESHKYTRGHALVAGGAVMTGAARLAARAAARARRRPGDGRGAGSRRFRSMPAR